MSRPRKTSELVVVNVKLYLRRGEDDDILRWFSLLPPRARARAVKSALRMGNAIVTTAGGGRGAPAGGDDNQDDLPDLLDQLLF